MQVTILPSVPRGTVQAPSSKSMAHRLLLAAGLSGGESTVRNLAESEDVLATLDCLKALGASVTLSDGTAKITGCDPKKRTRAVTLPCRESGSTLRFFLPLCLLSDAPAVLTGSEKLLSRPLSVYETLCRQRGIFYENNGRAVSVCGTLQGGAFSLSGSVSSQFVTGLLYALPLLTADSVISLVPPVESRSYIDLTLFALHSFGVRAEWTKETELTVSGRQRFLPQDATVEGDWSNAAYLEGLNLVGGNVTVTGLDEASRQGDRVYRELFARLQRGTPRIDLSDCPDLGPALFALSAAQNGATFTGVGRLRGKESDRVAAMREELRKFGVKTVETESTLTVFPGLVPPKTALSGHNDHRIVMALSLLLTKTGGTIDGAEAVNKSFPDFFERFQKLGTEVRYAVDQR